MTKKERLDWLWARVEDLHEEIDVLEGEPEPMIQAFQRSREEAGLAGVETKLAPGVKLIDSYRAILADWARLAQN